MTSAIVSHRYIQNDVLVVPRTLSTNHITAFFSVKPLAENMGGLGRRPGGWERRKEEEITA